MMNNHYKYSVLFRGIGEHDIIIISFIFNVSI